MRLRFLATKYPMTASTSNAAAPPNDQWHPEFLPGRRLSRFGRNRGRKLHGNSGVNGLSLRGSGGCDVLLQRGDEQLNIRIPARVGNFDTVTVGEILDIVG